MVTSTPPVVCNIKITLSKKVEEGALVPFDPVIAEIEMATMATWNLNLSCKKAKTLCPKFLLYSTILIAGKLYCLCFSVDTYGMVIK